MTARTKRSLRVAAEEALLSDNFFDILGVTEDPRFYGLTPMCAPIHVSV